MTIMSFKVSRLTKKKKRKESETRPNSIFSDEEQYSLRKALHR